MNLPPIVESAKSRPLSYDPRTDEFIYYDDVEQEQKKIYPLEKLTPVQKLKLAIERQLTNPPSITGILDQHVYTNEEIAAEMRAQTKFGKQMFDADMNYLDFYLSQFPKEAFQQVA